jgi:hypothetical protein
MRIFSLLFIPKVLSFKNSINPKKILNRLPFALLGVIFWLFIYIIFSRILIYFKGIEGFGDILSAKLLSMVFLSFLSLLVMSNIITALSTFYLSKDVDFLLTTPLDIKKIQSAKTIETFLLSSWMVMSFALPVLIAYGNVYRAGIFYYLGLPFIFTPFLLLFRRALMVKDLKIFLRDNSQWPQLLLLLALVVIYVYNFRVLPLDLIPEASFIISNFIAFFNLILAGFVLSAVAARFLFPAVSLEGQAFWIIKASPVTMRDFLRSKLISGLIPLILLSEILVFVTNLILHIEGVMMFISMSTILLMTLAIGGLGIGLGAVYPRFEYNNIASISMGFGGFLFMILALFSVTLTVLFEAWPLYLYLSDRVIGKAFNTWGIAQACISFIIVIILNVACFYVPLKIGTRNIEGERWM